MKKSYKPILNPKTHQVEGVNSMLKGNIANFDDQGLGKCKQAYDMAGKMLESGQIDIMIMVSKASLRTNFYIEVAKDAYQLIAKTASGSKADRRALYRYPSYHVLIVSYENVITDIEDLKILLQSCKTLLCLDEAHYIKNPKAQRTQACLELSKLAFKSTIFSGTPIPNSINDIYTQLKFIGENVGDTLDEFKERFGSLDDFKNYLQDRMIRRKKSDLKELNLPGKNIRIVPVNLSPEELSIYKKASDELLIEFQNKLGRKTVIPINSILARLVRLTQLTSNPQMLISSYDGNCSKLNALNEIVTNMCNQEEKLIIWTGYRKNVQLLLQKYSSKGAVSIYGGMTKDEIAESVDRFQNDPNCQLLIAVPACAREGFTLTKARRAVYLDRNFNLLDWVQSQDRIHRISQTRECEIIVLEAVDTIDNKISEVLNRKDHLQQFLLGDIPEYHGLENIDLNEVKKLLSGTSPKKSSKSL
jgi:SWI/SNF-related matrix-associated actin-dependent regulator 1 of chromatin subfamily A